MLRVDAASGISFSAMADEQELLKVYQLADRIASKGQGLSDVREKMAQTQHQPLPMLILLQGMRHAVTSLWTVDKGAYKPLCLIMQFAPTLFPEGDFDRRSELDRQRLGTFLNSINDPFFSKSGSVILLVSDTKTEINRHVLALPVTEHLAIPLPSAIERAHFVTQYVRACAHPT